MIFQSAGLDSVFMYPVLAIHITSYKSIVPLVYKTRKFVSIECVHEKSLLFKDNLFLIKMKS